MDSFLTWHVLIIVGVGVVPLAVIGLVVYGLARLGARHGVRDASERNAARD